MGTDVAHLFATMAACYEEARALVRAPLDQVLHAFIRSELRPPADGVHRRALDAGCGTGFQTRVLGELGYACHGVDLSAGLLAVARRTLPGGRPGPREPEDLPYPDGAFDVASRSGRTLSLVGPCVRSLAC